MLQTVSRTVKNIDWFGYIEFLVDILKYFSLLLYESVLCGKIYAILYFWAAIVHDGVIFNIFLILDSL